MRQVYLTINRCERRPVGRATPICQPFGMGMRRKATRPAHLDRRCNSTCGREAFACHQWVGFAGSATMVRKLRSPSRTISNRGPSRRFTGEFPCTKSVTIPLVFDSISSLYCAVALEHRKNVVRIEFEPRMHTHAATSVLAALTAITDFEVTLDTSELRPVEAKYSESSLRDKERTHLMLLAEHCEAEGRPLEVVYRDVLERDGFINTVLLLRRYGLLPQAPASVANACRRLEGLETTTLEVWRERAQAARVPTGLLYYLLYHQELPLTYRTLLPMALAPCRV